jgi:hypothetical protein
MAVAGFPSRPKNQVPDAPGTKPLSGFTRVHDESPQNAKRVYEATSLQWVPGLRGGNVLAPVWYTVVYCPECEKERERAEDKYLDEHGLESGLFAWTNYSPLTEQDAEDGELVRGELVCSVCGLILRDGDLEKLTAEDKLAARVEVNDRRASESEYVATHRAEFVAEWVEEMGRIPPHERQFLMQTAAASRERAIRADDARLERAKHYRGKAIIHAETATYQILRLEIPHPTKPGRMLAIEDAIIYINPYNNQASVLVHYTKAEIEKAGIYSWCDEGKMLDPANLLKIPQKDSSLNPGVLIEGISRPGVWIHLDNQTRRAQLDKITNIPHSRGRDQLADLNALHAILPNGMRLTYTAIRKALKWPDKRAQRLVKAHPGEFLVSGGGQKGRQIWVQSLLAD